MDEIALKKGHRGFVVFVTTRDAESQLKLLGVLPDRQIETVEKFLSAIPQSLRATVRAACVNYVRRLRERGKKGPAASADRGRPISRGEEAAG